MSICVEYQDKYSVFSGLHTQRLLIGSHETIIQSLKRAQLKDCGVYALKIKAVSHKLKKKKSKIQIFMYIPVIYLISGAYIP